MHSVIPAKPRNAERGASRDPEKFNLTNLLDSGSRPPEANSPGMTALIYFETEHIYDNAYNIRL